MLGSEQRLSISTQEMEDIPVVAVRGWLDRTTAPDLEAVLKRLVEQGRAQIVIDLNGVEHMTSAGFRLMIATRRSAQRRNGDLYLCNPSLRINDLFNLAGMSSVFHIYESRADAVRSLAAAEA